MDIGYQAKTTLFRMQIAHIRTTPPLVLFGFCIVTYHSSERHKTRGSRLMPASCSRRLTHSLNFTEFSPRGFHSVRLYHFNSSVEFTRFSSHRYFLATNTFIFFFPNAHLQIGILIIAVIFLFAFFTRFFSQQKEPLFYLLSLRCQSSISLYQLCRSVSAES